MAESGGAQGREQERPGAELEPEFLRLRLSDAQRAQKLYAIKFIVAGAGCARKFAGAVEQASIEQAANMGPELLEEIYGKCTVSDNYDMEMSAKLGEPMCCTICYSAQVHCNRHARGARSSRNGWPGGGLLGCWEAMVGNCVFSCAAIPAPLQATRCSRSRSIPHPPTTTTTLQPMR